MIGAVRTLGVVFCGLSCLAAPAWALPMAPEDCDRARSEQTSLETAGVKSDMAQGAAWAQTHLQPDRLKRIARWIELEEQIQFRCPRPKPPPATVAQPDGGEPVPKNSNKPQKPKTAQKPKPQSASAESESGDGTGDAAKSAKPKPPAQKKPRTDDAYRPPAPFSGDELQHAVPGVVGPAGGTGLAP